VHAIPFRTNTLLNVSLQLILNLLLTSITLAPLQYVHTLSDTRNHENIRNSVLFNQLTQQFITRFSQNKKTRVLIIIHCSESSDISVLIKI